MAHVAEPARARFAVIAPAGFTGTEGPFPSGPVAVAVEGDRILWACSPDDLGAAVALDPEGPGIVRFDDGFLMPGFHDAHIHMFHSALYASPLAERYCGQCEADAVARLAPLAARRPAGSWLLAQGWREYLWDPPAMPSRASLDAAYPGRPVALYSGDAHTLWLNGCALERLGIDEESVPPAGGSYDKDAQGRLTGIVREAAAMELMPRITAEFAFEELVDAYRSFLETLACQGITAVCDVSLMALPGLDFIREDIYRALEGRGQLTVRVSLFPTLLEEGSRLHELERSCPGPLLEAKGYKQFYDGVSSQHTAWLHDPYANARFEGDCGRPTVDPQVMDHLIRRAVAEGCGVRIHAIGDEAIHRALDGFERAFAEWCRSAAADGRGFGTREGISRRTGNDFSAAHAASGHECIAFSRDQDGEIAGGEPASANKPVPVCTLEHLENFQPEDIERLARLGVVASVQPRHMTLDPGGPERDLGPDRLPYMWPFRKLLDAGATLAFGTDSPVTETDPFKVLYTAITRKEADTGLPEGGWLFEERLTVGEALYAYTAGSARAAGRGHELGKLKPGMFADFIVLDRNPFLVSPEELLETQVLATFVGGRRIR